MLPEQSQLTGTASKFFEGQLEGKVINLSASDDVSGEYAEWFETELEGNKAVIWRPDFIVYGAAKDAEGIEALVEGLRKKIAA